MEKKSEPSKCRIYIIGYKTHFYVFFSKSESGFGFSMKFWFRGWVRIDFREKSHPEPLSGM